MKIILAERLGFISVAKSIQRKYKKDENKIEHVFRAFLSSHNKSSFFFETQETLWFNTEGSFAIMIDTTRLRKSVSLSGYFCNKNDSLAIITSWRTENVFKRTFCIEFLWRSRMKRKTSGKTKFLKPRWQISRNPSIFRWSALKGEHNMKKWCLAIKIWTKNQTPRRGYK